MEQPTHPNQNPSTRRVVWSKTTTTSTRYINGRPTKTTRRVLEDATPENQNNKIEEGQRAEADKAPAKALSQKFSQTEDNNRTRDAKGRHRGSSMGGFLRGLSFVGRGGKTIHNSQEPPEEAEEIDEQTSLISLSGDSSIEEEDTQAAGSTQCRRTMLAKGTSTTSIQKVNGRKETTTRVVEDATPEEIEMAKQKQQSEARHGTSRQGPCRRMMLSKTRSTTSIQNLNGRKVTTTRVVEDATPEEIEMARRKQQSAAEKGSKRQESRQTYVTSKHGHPQAVAVPKEINLPRNAAVPVVPVCDAKKVVRFGAVDILEYVVEQEEESEYEYEEVSDSESEYEYEEVSQELSDTSSTGNIQNVNGRKVTTTRVVVEDATPEEIEMARKKQQAEAEQPNKLHGPFQQNLLISICAPTAAGPTMNSRNPMLTPTTSAASIVASSGTGPAVNSVSLFATPTASSRQTGGPAMTTASSSVAPITAAPSTASPAPVVGPIEGHTIKPASPSPTPTTASSPATGAVPSTSEKKKSDGGPKKRRTSKKKSKGLDLSCPIMTMNQPGNEKLWMHSPDAHDTKEDTSTATTTTSSRNRARSQSPKRTPKFPSNKPRSRGVCAR